MIPSSVRRVVKAVELPSSGTTALGRAVFTLCHDADGICGKPGHKDANTDH